MYNRIEDVDLFIGAISEKLVPGSTLGPTFQCIVGDQFRRLRLGDRFWYEEPNQVGSFTLGNYFTVALYNPYFKIMMLVVCFVIFISKLTK